MFFSAANALEELTIAFAKARANSVRLMNLKSNPLAMHSVGLTVC